MSDPLYECEGCGHPHPAKELRRLPDGSTCCEEAFDDRYGDTDADLPEGNGWRDQQAFVPNPDPDQPCQHPSRQPHGWHEWYTYGKRKGAWVCRACGARKQEATDYVVAEPSMAPLDPGAKAAEDARWGDLA